ncbi:MAG: outer membrane beta-barrel protein [Leptolyngbya sp. SIO4C1]|nr:outer membrane beta-barrel protein [Leptolyngbya sp. SIO4C1]
MASRWMTAGAVGTAIAIAGAHLLSAAPAQAQAAYGSYVGIGGALGLTEDDNDEGGGFSVVVAGRYKLLELPISLRAQAFLFGGSTAIVPTVSYDYPLNFQTDLYVGAGLAFAGSDDDDDPSPVGDTTSFVIQPGVDYALPDSNLVIFGNAIFAFDAYEDGGGTATSIQGGVGYQF